jgi:hypothetical protein
MSQLKSLVSLIFECCQDPRKHHLAVYEKYASGKYKRASTFVEGEIAKGFTLSFPLVSSRLATPSIFDDELHCAARDAGLLIPIEG